MVFSGVYVALDLSWRRRRWRDGYLDLVWLAARGERGRERPSTTLRGGRGILPPRSRRRGRRKNDLPLWRESRWKDGVGTAGWWGKGPWSVFVVEYPVMAVLGLLWRVLFFRPLGKE